MAIIREPTAHEVGEVFATAARGESAVRELWASKARDGIHLWLLIEPIDGDAERELYALLDGMDERFPDTDIQLHLFNPLCFAHDPRESLPTGAERIYVRAA
jgi:hypothetical protein